MIEGHIRGGRKTVHFTSQGWESIPGLLKRFTNTGSAVERDGVGKIKNPFSSCSVDSSSKDDVTVINLLGVSFIELTHNLMP
jgi:hypothetical protein